MRDLQLANQLESRAIRLRSQAVSRVIMSFAGTPAGGFVKFIVDMFGSAKDFSEAEAAATLQLPIEDPDQEEEQDEEDETVSSATPASTPKLPDVCELSQAKPAFPINKDLLSASGVPQEFYTKLGIIYYCSYGECAASSGQKDSLLSHVRRKHIGAAVSCRFCGMKWWTSRPFVSHMQKHHPELIEPEWWTPIDEAKLQAEEQEVAMSQAAMETDPPTQDHPETVSTS